MTALAVYLMMGLGPALIILTLAWIIAFEGTRHDRRQDTGQALPPPEAR
ncbi:MAG: hypothetical protein H0W83_07960 [Planctomycetes bacterium]|nr:hypothetical protein [Planctomycetota bacterium]